MAQDLAAARATRLAAAFPVEDGDELLLVTDQRPADPHPVGQVRIVGRNTQGVIIFRTADDEHVVSVERLADTGGGDEATEADEGGED